MELEEVWMWKSVTDIPVSMQTHNVLQVMAYRTRIGPEGVCPRE